ncbi:nucleoside/nucleotide kinase family protein [Rhodoferax antarcticus]|uniref:Putative pantothenate kinase n=1 Tax=Rhodoferax antarcticus ANT.BR TaxID=1111071 RepID=A0A1Q8YDW1_9BURK|nr:nucleoside/nucleotide kinase family protein [Rhodoferax antarcticus]APW46088.1 nucleoside/nucleotide kinase family protein [Rhodoferax antarcticus]MCW2310351.1 pantothenate kinase [Rhodoferax antarcticus]OLP06246.1 putative pantothenate kinase [Rhodoferax antarcticus ANT.BR]
MSIPTTIILPDLCSQRITDLLASGSRRILGIAGAPGAGKSTLVQAIATQFGEAVQPVPMDGFHLANSELLRLGRRGRKGAPDTFDAAGYVNLMRRLKHHPPDEVVYAPDYRRHVEEAIAGAIAVDPATPLVVTEGNYLLLEDAPWNQLPGMLDEIWFLDVPDELRRQRLVARHMRFGRTEQQALDWMASTDEPNALRITQGRVRADVQVSWH